MGEYIKIASTRTDGDSSADEDLFTDLAEHSDYNYDHAIRSGTDAVGVRLALARGSKAFTVQSGAAVMGSHTVTLSAANDGDPNFLSAPRVFLSVREDDTSATAWSTIDAASAFVEDEPSAATFGIGIRIDDGGNNSFKGFVDWLAIGPVTAGE